MMIYKLLLCLLFLTGVSFAGGFDIGRDQVPPTFIRNEGQWDRSVRYAMLNGSSALWFLDDGLVITRPRTGLDLPLESPNAGVGSQSAGIEVIRLRYRNASTRLRLRATDTARAVSHFYLGADSASWREHVSNHHGLRYENVWDGVDIEFDAEGGTAEAGWKEIVPDGSAGPSVRIRDRRLASPARGGYEVTRDGVSTVSLYDSLPLATFMSFIGPGGRQMADADEGYVYLFGHAPHDFPLHGAWHSPTVPGQDYSGVVKYDPTSRNVVYSTYFGPSRGSTGTMRLLNVWNEKVHVFCGAQFGFPVNRSLPGSIPPTDSNDYKSAVFVLDASGRMEASSFIGGPGKIAPITIHRRGEELYLLGIAEGDSLAAITGDAIEKTAFFDPGRSLVFGIISANLDSTKYLSYLCPLREKRGPSILFGGSTPEMHVDDSDGSMVFVIPTSIIGEYDAPIRRPIVPTETIAGKAGVYVAKFSRTANDYEYATWYGLADRGFWHGESHLRDNGDLVLYGATYPRTGSFTLPGAWKTLGTEIPNTRGGGRGLMVGVIDASGRSKGGFDVYLGLPLWTPSATIAESMCGMLLFSGRLRWDPMNPPEPGMVMPLLNAFDSISIAHNDYDIDDQFLLAIDMDRMEFLYSSYWNHPFWTRMQTPWLSSRPNGYVLSSDSYLPYIPRTLTRTPDWRMLGSTAETGVFTVDLRVPTPCWKLSCTLGTIDSLRIERARGYGEPREFDVTFELVNASDAMGARILRASLDVPPGLEFVAGASTQAMLPSTIGAGMTARTVWTLRVNNPSLIGDTIHITCKAFYVDPASGAEWPAAEEWCGHDILVSRYDEEHPRLACRIEGPTEVYWTGDGYSETSGGEPGLLRYQVTYENVSDEAVTVASFQQSSAQHCRVIRNAFWPGMVLPPSGTVTFPIDVRIDALRFDRKITVRTAAVDAYGLPWSDCEMRTFIPGVPALPCDVDGPTRVVWNTTLGTVEPAELEYILQLDNPLDTMRVDIRTQIDLSAARHLLPAPGDSITRPSLSISPKSDVVLNWRVVPAQQPAVPTQDTIRFLVEVDGIVSVCEKVVILDVIDETLLCTITMTDSIDADRIVTRDALELLCVWNNTGTVPVGIDRFELRAHPSGGVLTPDPLIRAGTVLAPGEDIELNWRIIPLALRNSRTIHFTLTAYGTDEKILSACEHQTWISSVDGLRCAITAPDSVRFHRDSLRYEPDPVPVHMDLANVLDTGESMIEAGIDLAGAPRFVLANGEIALKTLAQLDSHSVVGFTWQLTPIAAATDDTQDIMIRYRSAEQGGWKECSTSIVIHAWPEISEVRCATGGHDSLVADAAYEAIVPDPIQLSYTATNTGTVPLTGCTAAIILPPGFALTGSDSIRSFGTDAPGSLAPGESATRWWTVTTNDQLQGFGAKDITWQWSSDQQGTGTGCTHTVQVVPDPSSGISFTPLRLFFEAELGGALPAAQTVKLWTGGGLSMPWTAQSDGWYIDIDPVAGDHTASIAVQPNTTMLNKGLHVSTLTLGGSAVNLPKGIVVDYLITSLTEVNEQPTARTLSLGPVYPHPIPLAGEARILLRNTQGQPLRVSLYDLLGRERALLREGVTTDSDVLYLRPATLGLSPGSYLLRVLSPEGQQSRLVTVVR
ncbi:MAG: hypothetical protein KFF77_06575 [Bacteroidetes bacterium]|nr:hypothetical protein [Bacteroidota bacterium]